MEESLENPQKQAPLWTEQAWSAPPAPAENELETEGDCLQSDLHAVVPGDIRKVGALKIEQWPF